MFQQDGSRHRMSVSSVAHSVPSRFTVKESHTADHSGSSPKPQVLQESLSSEPRVPCKKEVSINLVNTCSELSDSDVPAECKRKKMLRVPFMSSRPKSKMFLQPKVMRLSALKANQLIDLQIQESEESQNVQKRKQKSKRRLLMAVGNRQAKNRDGGVDRGQPVDNVGSQPCEGEVNSRQKSKQHSSMMVEQANNQENSVDSGQPVDKLASPSCEDDVNMDIATSLPPFQVLQERKVSHFAFHVVQIVKYTFSCYTLLVTKCFVGAKGHSNFIHD